MLIVLYHHLVSLVGSHLIIKILLYDDFHLCYDMFTLDVNM